MKMWLLSDFGVFGTSKFYRRKVICTIVAVIIQMSKNDYYFGPLALSEEKIDHLKF